VTALQETLRPDDLTDAIEACFERGWTDGLPVVPPTPSLVRRFLDQTDRDPSEVIWSMRQVRRGCTVEAAAINAAMAGCRPEYFPVVLAALEAVIDEGWPGNGGWQSTTGGGPLLIVNGPVRRELGFNSRGNILGPGFRPNATVGRAIRLIIMNAYGVRPHDLDQAAHGMPGKYSLCVAENEEESPWEPLHVELGHDAATSLVSAVHTRSTEHIHNSIADDMRAVLNDITDTASRTGAMTTNRRVSRRVVVIIGLEHARKFAAAGFGKRDVKEYIAEHSGRPAGQLRRNGRGGAIEPATLPDDASVRLIESPDDVVVVVAGAGNAGLTTVLQTLGFPPKTPGTAVVRQTGTRSG